VVEHAERVALDEVKADRTVRCVDAPLVASFVAAPKKDQRVRFAGSDTKS
jgi:hypothetical protein